MGLQRRAAGMTTGYAFISIIALVCYLFLFLTFIAAKKNNLINIFMFVLIQKNIIIIVIMI